MQKMLASVLQLATKATSKTSVFLVTLSCQ